LTQAKRFGRYWLLQLIARGGMGEVYLAATTGIEGAERPCVVKIIRREHAKDASFLARFLDEARVQAQLHHTGVVQVIEAATDEQGEPFVVVEYVEGRSLGEVRARALQVSYRMSWAEATALAASAAEALAHVHERVDVRGNPLGIVHRDVSPQNIMVGYGGDVKLIDFGTARGENRRCHTVSGVVFAKPGYVAPEVANGKSGDARVDLYALGVMLWELTAGRRFLQGDATEHLAAVAKNRRRPPPIAQLVAAPETFDAIISKLTAYRPDDRYATARAALKDLAGLLSRAASLSNGERGVRPRIAQLMSTLYPSEPTHSRRVFAKLVAQARKMDKESVAVPEPFTAESGDRATPEPDDRLLPGTRYRVLRKIGEGAMGMVWEAEHVDLGRRVALKILAAEHATSSEYAARFRREARALSRLSHPNLVTLHDFGQATDGRLFCAMELLAGETLEHKLAQDKAIPWREAMQLGLQAAAALRDAHAVGLVHRDLKPSNLFVCDDGTLKLLDFGVAKTADEAGDGADDPSSFTLLGTPEYMAPEQVSSGKVDARADVYALGCVLYELCTGRRPFVEQSTVALLDAKLKSDPESPRHRAASREIPVGVDRLIMRAMSRDPGKRTASAEMLLDQLRGVLEAPARRRRHRRAIGRVVLTTGLLVALLSTGSALARRFPEQLQAALTAPTAAPELGLTDAVPRVDSPSRQASPQGPADAPAPSAQGAVQVAAVAQDAVLEEPRVVAERAAARHDWQTAARAAQVWVDAERSFQAQLFLARMLIHLDRGDAAVPVLEDLLREVPESREAASLLAVAKHPLFQRVQARTLEQREPAGVRQVARAALR
jgi:serine/threonine-protein kinase